MLRGAVQKHELKQTAAAASTIACPSAPMPSAAASQSANPGFKNPFKPTTSSTLNGLSGSQQRAQRVAGVKRTSSGLAKVLDASFEEELGSQYSPITLDDVSPQKNKVVQVTANVFVDENDFDSDIDLDFKEPGVSKAVKYPSLPQAAKSNSPIRPIVYPTLPRQQQAQPDVSHHNDLGLQSRSLAQALESPTSEIPLPWSSSPAEHFQPRSIAAAMARQPNGPQAESLKPVNPGDIAPADTKAKKSRVLPWAAGKAAQDDVVDQRPANSSFGPPPKPTVQATPKDKKSPYLWNTSASAVKEQQKMHREQFKKPTILSTKNDGEEEAVIKAKSSRERPARVFLSEEQQHVVNLVLEQKKSVFFTGSAGTGKSVLMREIISSLRVRYKREPDRIAVTASTGLAACNVGGVTLHSFAGIGLGKEDVPQLVRKIKKNQKARHRWMRTKVLVVDEISMVDGELFDKLEAIARQIRNNGRPFGGIQLVITGDFFQLPPVPDHNKASKFAFDASTWSTTVEHTIGLHHVFRQKDPVFASMLNEMREGRMSQASITAFQKLSRPLKFDDTVECTELYARREEVERANRNRLDCLQGQAYVFPARDGGTITDVDQRTKLLSNCMAPENITLKKGAQVMLIKNIDETLVNGSIGQVLGFMDEQQFDRYSTHDNEDAAPTDNATKSIQDKRLVLDNITAARQYPVCRFLISDGTTRDLLCQPESWKVELPNGEVQASRTQVPLILAWAMSIHKAQGQTLERVTVDLGKVFEKGQAYVALSRATSMAGLQVLRFDPKKVAAHDRVTGFYANLSRIELGAKKVQKASGAAPARSGAGLQASDYEKLFLEDEWADAP